jgi:hypothetical protein
MDNKKCIDNKKSAIILVYSHIQENLYNIYNILRLYNVLWYNLFKFINITNFYSYVDYSERGMRLFNHYVTKFQEKFYNLHAEEKLTYQLM